MLIGGLQKFSLLEYPGCLSAVLFTQGCNFRCPYCHNPALVDPAQYGRIHTEEAVLLFLDKRKGKLDAVTVSGGEPTLQPDLLPFLHRLKSMGYKVKLDTNGSLPDVISQIIKDNVVDYWAMDIKAPLPLYSTLAGCFVAEECITRSMNLIRSSGKQWEFRTTYFHQVLNWNDILEIQALLQPGDHYYLQRCRYDTTLINLEEAPSTHIDSLFGTLNDLPSAAYLNLSKDCQARNISFAVR